MFLHEILQLDFICKLNLKNMENDLLFHVPYLLIQFNLTKYFDANSDLHLIH